MRVYMIQIRKELLQFHSVTQKSRRIFEIE